MPDWLTPDGVDLGKVPLEPMLRRILDEDEGTFSSTCTVLGAMSGHGRRDAGVFLLGLLSYYRGDFERLSSVVRALGEFHSPEAADALTAELHRVPSSNKTRRYLDAVLEALAALPDELARGRLVTLSGDRSFSPKRRQRFQSTLWDLDGDDTPHDGGW